MLGAFSQAQEATAQERRHSYTSEPLDNDLMFPYPDRSLRVLTERCQEHRLKGVP
jgi:hypothetical protein